MAAIVFVFDLQIEERCKKKKKKKLNRVMESDLSVNTGDALTLDENVIRLDIKSLYNLLLIHFNVSYKDGAHVHPLLIIRPI